MDYIFLVISIVVSIYGYTFARWLGRNDNKLGKWGVFLLLVINVSLSIYNLVA